MAVTVDKSPLRAIYLLSRYKIFLFEAPMVGMFGQKVWMGQANGPDVELVVRGTELYGTYETPEGYPVVYDEKLGLFCYARVVDGAFVSTGVSAASSPPPALRPHAQETDELRMKKIEERTRQIEERSHKEE